MKLAIIKNICNWASLLEAKTCHFEYREYCLYPSGSFKPHLFYPTLVYKDKKYIYPCNEVKA